MNLRRLLDNPWARLAVLVLLAAVAVLLLRGEPDKPAGVRTPGPAPATVAPGPIIEAPRLVLFDMFNESEGWAVTEAGVATTDDGGQTWYDATPLGITEAGYLVVAEFLDPLTAWVLSPDQADPMRGGTLFHTVDGGGSWSSTVTPFGGGDLAFVDANVGWMMADMGAGAGSQAVAVFLTSDGGTSWSLAYTNDPTRQGSGNSLPLGGQKHFIEPLSAGSAFVGGVIYAPGTVYLYRSDDQGATWRQVGLKMPAGVEEAELAAEQLEFRSPETGLLVMRVTGESMQIVAYSTGDGGLTWTPWPTVVDGGGPLVFVNSSEAVAFGADDFVMTRDAGKTWDVVEPDIQFVEALASMDWVSLDLGWVLTFDINGQRSLYKTVDGGATWEPIVP